jgi:alanyl-tRNA synthetase
MTSSEIRQQYIDFFKERQHIVVPGAPVVPIHDPTLLFTNAGMNQFKDYFLERAVPPANRVVNTQKCIRVSGKHNDLEEVGQSLYHHTFFEMLGNWSFGDYFKQDAIRWAWELVTDVWGLPRDRLYATVFEGEGNLPADEEAEGFWKSETDIDPRHVSQHGKKDNFWEMGDTGPCGPCSEIHIDRGEEFCNLRGTPHRCEVNGDCQRFIEIWNLVFIQFDKDESGVLTPLPAKHVDTGAGFERFCAVLQNAKSNYDTDLFLPIISRITDLTGVPYVQGEDGIPHRVISDHIRCLTFAISDGVMPGNEGRGYVIRRILRRASRFARKLEVHEPILYRLVDTVVGVLGEVFPEIRDKQQHCEMVVQAEEEAFGKTLDRGLDIYGGMASEVRKSSKTVIPGGYAFRLYDTYGFPLDLTELMAREDGFTVDTEGFRQEMAQQRERARRAQRFGGESDVVIDDSFEVVSRGSSSDFVGYEDLETQSEIRKWHRDEDRVQFTLDRTPFYAESGGQVGDQGRVEGKDLVIEVDDVVWAGDEILHMGRIVQGSVDGVPDPEVVASVDRKRRWAIQRNHTTTHLLQAALRKLYGLHVNQAGSLVHPDYLRFDYTHIKKASNEDIEQVERWINEWVQANIELNIRYTTFSQAQKDGVIAIFGEKYGEEVRVVEVPGVSKELCGGCHVQATGDIGLVRVRSETAAAAGVRRIDAVTGDGAVIWSQEQTRTIRQMEEALQSFGSDPYEKLLKVMDDRKALERDIESLKGKVAASASDTMLDEIREYDGIRYVSQMTMVSSMDDLKKMGDVVRDKIGSGVAILGAIFDGRPAVVCVATADAIRDGIDVVTLARAIGKRMGGGGGGNPRLATAGGKNAQALESILRDSEQIFREVGFGRKSST